MATRLLCRSFGVYLTYFPLMLILPTPYYPPLPSEMRSHTSGEIRKLNHPVFMSLDSRLRRGFTGLHGVLNFPGPGFVMSRS
jgi:hypothetical protein